jgi:hypothetical protein
MGTGVKVVNGVASGQWAMVTRMRSHRSLAHLAGNTLRLICAVLGSEIVATQSGM